MQKGHGLYGGRAPVLAGFDPAIFIEPRESSST